MLEIVVKFEGISLVEHLHQPGRYLRSLCLWTGGTFLDLLLTFPQGFNSVSLVENSGIFHLFTHLTVLLQFGSEIRNIFCLLL